jgi:hypothetical protein
MYVFRKMRAQGHIYLIGKTSGYESVTDLHQTNSLILLCLGKAGVVVDEGPNFRVEVRDVPVPEISTYSAKDAFTQQSRCLPSHITDSIKNPMRFSSSSM